jgi:hypothetical protein
MRVMSWLGSNDGSLRQVLRGAARLEVTGSVESGIVAKVVGRARADGALVEAPLTGRHCIAYAIAVEDPAISEVRATAFSITDGACRARVETERLRLMSVHETLFDSGFLNDADPRVRAFLRRHGHSSKRSGIFYVNRTLSCVEQRLEVDDLVTVVGRVRADAGSRQLSTVAGHGYRDAPQQTGIDVEFGPLADGVVLVSRND